MSGDEIITIVIERAQFGVTVHTPERGWKRKLLSAYNREGWHLKSAHRRAFNGVFYEDRYLSEILELLSGGQDSESIDGGMVAQLMAQLEQSGKFTIGVPVCIAMPLLGVKGWQNVLI